MPVSANIAKRIIKNYLKLKTPVLIIVLRVIWNLDILMKKTQCNRILILKYFDWSITAQKMKFFIKDFFSKCDQICRKLWIWSHLL